MKSKVWARVIAVMLCMVLMLRTGITVLAETGPEAQEQTTEKERKTEETSSAFFFINETRIFYQIEGMLFSNPAVCWCRAQNASAKCIHCRRRRRYRPLP